MSEFFLRLRLILIIIVSILLLTLFLVFPTVVEDIAQSIQDQEDPVRVGLVLAAVLIDLLLIWILVQELRMVRQNVRGLLVRSGDATAKVSLESVEKNLEAQVVRIEDIFAAHADVQAERGKVLVEMEIDARDTIDVRKKTKEINRDITRIVDKQLGLSLGGKPVIKFNLMSQPPVENANIGKPNLISRENSTSINTN